MPGIQQTMDVVALVDKLADIAIASKADGKVDWRDAPLAISLIGPLRVALDGAGEIPAEIADLDAAEAQAALSKAVAVLFKFAKIAM